MATFGSGFMVKGSWLDEPLPFHFLLYCFLYSIASINLWFRGTFGSGFRVHVSGFMLQAAGLLYLAPRIKKVSSEN